MAEAVEPFADALARERWNRAVAQIASEPNIAWGPVTGGLITCSCPTRPKNPLEPMVHGPGCPLYGTSIVLG